MMYNCLARPWLQRLAAVILAAASFMVVWSEATIGTGKNPDLSPFSHVRLSVASCQNLCCSLHPHRLQQE